MLKRASSVVLALSILVLLAAMGGKGGGFERAPRVEKNFSVVVLDRSGNKISGDKFSWEGRIRFSGYLGLAEVNLPFDRIKSVTIGEKRDRRVKVTAKMTDGSETVIDVDSDTRCFGEAGFGSFKLAMDEIQSVEFKGIKQ